MNPPAIAWLLPLALAVPIVMCSPSGVVAQNGSLSFGVNAPGEYDFADQPGLPPSFGRGEFTLELWVKPDTSLPVGEVYPGTYPQLRNWSDIDRRPYATDGWWLQGNWLLDGLSRPQGFDSGDTRAGSFGLQFYGGGRIRWTFGDDDRIIPVGQVWGVQVGPASNARSLLDGEWHHVACVRRWAEGGGAVLELWVDGELLATTEIPQRVDMRRYWDRVPHPDDPAELGGWSWGSEVMTAWRVYFTQYEDYKGLVDELRFWDRALSPRELTEEWGAAVHGSEPGLVGWFPMDEGRGEVAGDRLDPEGRLILHPRGADMWSAESAPLVGLRSGRP